MCFLETDSLELLCDVATTPTRLPVEPHSYVQLSGLKVHKLGLPSDILTVGFQRNKMSLKLFIKANNVKRNILVEGLSRGLCQKEC